MPKETDPKKLNTQNDPHKTRAVNEADSLGLEDALNVATGVETEDSKKKVETQQIEIVNKEIPEKLKYTPINEIDGKKTVKSDFEGAAYGSIQHVASSELYKDVTDRILKAKQQAEVLTEGDVTFFKAEKPSAQQKLDIKQAKLDAKQMRIANKANKQALADYDTSGAVTDKIAQNESYLRQAEARRRKMRLIAIVVIVLLLLFLLAFGVSVLVNNVTGFTVNLTGGDHTKGLTLYDNAKLEGGSVRLTTKDIPECDNITYRDLLDKAVNTIDKGEGQQSMQFNYFAYSFWVQNVGRGEVDYDFKINMGSTTKGVDDAVRIMVISDSTFYGDKNNKRIVNVYAKPECDPISGEWRFENGLPKMQKLFDINNEIFPEQDQDKAIAFYGARIPVIQKVKGLGYKAGQNTRKYTIIIYLEGGDIDCVSNIKGGGIKFTADFTVTDYRLDI